VDDIVQGVMGALEYDGVPFDIFNLGENQTITLTDLISEIEKALGKKAVIERLPEQQGDMPLTSANITKARSLLGYDRRRRSPRDSEFVESVFRANDGHRNRFRTGPHPERQSGWGSARRAPGRRGDAQSGSRSFFPSPGPRSSCGRFCRVSDIVVAKAPIGPRPGKPAILFAPHTDTVSVYLAMTIDPFSGEVRETAGCGDAGRPTQKGPMARDALGTAGNGSADRSSSL